MLNKKVKRKLKNEVSAGSMADIAFLLLIFFLVTTTIDIDKGIRVMLPPFIDVNTPPPPIPPKNILSVKINAQNQLLVEGEIMKVHQLRETTKIFIINPNNDTDKPDKPTKAVVSLQNDRGTNYEIYLEVYNELKAAYNELWNEKANNTFGIAYESLGKVRQKDIRKQIPLVISEAEPTEYAAN